MTKFRQQLKSTWLPCLAYGLGVGAFVGVVVVLFKLAAEWIIEKSAHLYQLVRDNPIWAVVLFVALVGIATATYFVQRWCKETKGGGIPRAEGAIKAVLSLRPLRTAVAIVVNSLLAFLAGLPLGSEGPSVLLGSSLGGITGKLSSEDQWNRYAMAGGASAGFAVATCAPLTGIVFVFEEILKEFKPVVFTLVAIAVATATGVSNLILDAFGHHPAPLFAIDVVANFALADIWVALLLGLVIGVGAVGFNNLTVWFGKLWGKYVTNGWIRMVVVFVLVGTIGFFLPQVLGGGAGVIVAVSDYAYPLGLLALVLVAKVFTISFANSSGATGGMFIPLLCVGALVGALCSKLFVAMGMDASLVPLVVLLSTSAFMGASTGAPLTATVFLLECGAGVENLLHIVVVTVVSYLVMNMLHQEPLYDINLHNLVKQENANK